jgi:hypothetical protein
MDARPRDRIEKIEKGEIDVTEFQQQQQFEEVSRTFVMRLAAHPTAPM